MVNKNKSLKDEYILLSATLLFGIVANFFANFWFKLIDNNFKFIDINYYVWATGIVSIAFMILSIIIIQKKYKKLFLH